MPIKQECFIILTPGFAADELDTTALPAIQSFVICLKENYPAIELKVISFQYPFKPHQYNFHNAEIIALGGKNKAHPFRLITWLKALYTIYCIKNKYHVKGVLSFWLTECALVGQYASRLFKIKQISWARGQDAKVGNRFLKLLKLNSHNLIVLSQQQLFHLSKSFSIANVRVVPSGVHPSYIDSIEGKEKGYDMLGVGSLTQLKNYQLFVEMIAELKKTIPNITAAIIGDGPQKTALQKLIVEKNLQQNIELKGKLQHFDVIAYMKASNIFLHTSSYEGQAAVFGEALYCGMRIVCFDVGRLHSNENMYVCIDEKQMVNELLQLISNKTKERKSILIRRMNDTVKEVIELF